MTSPKLAQDSPWGRLYVHPDRPVPAGMQQPEAARSGLLVPSVTNIIDVLDKPFLRTWAARLAAETAYEMAEKFPERVAQDRRAAVNYAKAASDRTRDASADLGTRVHDVLENLAYGRDVEITPQIAPFVKSWERFIADWEPEWIALEMTMFGTIQSPNGPLGYAGTADGVARLKDGTRVVLDYKTGKSIHSTASLQMAALAHTETGIEENGTVVPAPQVDAGLVIHVTAKGYKVYPVADLDGLPWSTFQVLREVWDWQAHESLHGAELSLIGPVKSDFPIPHRSGN